MTPVLLLHYDPAISIHNVTEENVPTPNDNDSNTDDNTDDDINVFNNTNNSGIYPYFVCTSIFLSLLNFTSGSYNDFNASDSCNIIKSTS